MVRWSTKRGPAASSAAPGNHVPSSSVRSHRVFANNQGGDLPGGGELVDVQAAKRSMVIWRWRPHPLDRNIYAHLASPPAPARPAARTVHKLSSQPARNAPATPDRCEDRRRHLSITPLAACQRQTGTSGTVWIIRPGRGKSEQASPDEQAIFAWETGEYSSVICIGRIRMDLPRGGGGLGLAENHLRPAGQFRRLPS